MHPISNDDSLRLRKLTGNDLPFCARLIEQAGWNQIEKDWVRVMNLDPEGCFVAEKNGQPAGTIVYTRFEEVAWISMVLVDKIYRGQGTGQWMFGQVMEKLRQEKIQTIRLDATHMGVNLYKKHGFEEEYEVIRLSNDKVVNLEGSPEGLNRLDFQDLDLVIPLDNEITGTDRRQLLEFLMNEEGTSAYISEEPAKSITGFTFLRPGRKGWQIGPCIAGTISSGIELLDKALESTRGYKAIVDIPVENEDALQWAKDFGFTEQRRFMRMYAGQKIDDHPDKIFACFGPEKG